jgi:hypothetical protein
MPDYPAEVLDERWLAMQTITIHTLARYQELLRIGELPASLDALLNDFVQFLTAGIKAPMEPRGVVSRVIA